jgi:conjugative transposon TraK protein
MKFTKPKSLESAFQYIRFLTIVVILACFLFCGFIVWRSDQKVTAAQNKIYLLYAGKALEAIASDRENNIPVEAKDHIKTFHEAFFTLDPDDKVINGNLSKALYLADGSAKRLSDNLKETGYYSGIISGNISQRINVDSIALELKTYPFYFRCYATIKIIRTTSIVTRNLITEGYLRNVSKSENNSHGFLIEKWVTLENRDLKVEAR